jgi:hypothetical protein
MSNTLSKEATNKTLPPDDLSDLTEEERKQVELFNEDLKEYKKPSKTKIEKMIDFETELDKWVWDRLPLSNAQKEELLYGIYLEDNNITDE